MPESLQAFDTYDACNAAVAAYQAAPSLDDRDRAAEDLYARLLPLVRKSLRRFCHPFYEESRCYSGACYPEELIGESYLWFREALDAFDTTRGVDFIGFAAKRLFWAGEHRVRSLRKNWYELTADGMPEDTAGDDSEEEKLLGRTLAESLLAQLDPRDAELVQRASEGFTSRELADWSGGLRVRGEEAAGADQGPVAEIGGGSALDEFAGGAPAVRYLPSQWTAPRPTSPPPTSNASRSRPRWARCSSWPAPALERRSA